MKDIESRNDIDHLMRVFYERALADEVIGYIFTDVAKLDLEHHLPIIGDFWETLLFRSGDYASHGRNPLEVHRQLHLRSAFEPKHFSRWLELFVQCVDLEFEGARADFIKMRAHAIANRFQENLGLTVSCEEIFGAAPVNQ
ncbi:MAG: group III truncated hemoglobin [Pyrinomonadaceae bacterium]|nr:group III truncated hemoglobin [Chloracidobacterium sp.]MBP7416697.1 group III truncated hemoglobin [Pyrinomonadaceae bacterium]